MPASQAESSHVHRLKHAASIRSWILVLLGWFAIVAASANGDVTATVDDDADSPRHDTNIEEVRVTADRVTDLTLEERRHIYKQLAQGRQLYSDSEYKRAFPLLLNTARHGFKEAQARVGYIYLNGLGEVTRDSAVAVGWLGVAASGNSSPGIENYFNDIWSQIPEQYVPRFREVVEKYESKYGEDATGVTCELRRPVGTHLKRLLCYFDEDLTLEERDLIEDMLGEIITGDKAVKQRMATVREQLGLPPVDDD